MVAEPQGDLFSLKGPLGSGSYGSVSLAETLDGQRKVVIKFVSVENLEAE